ncbi:hypothetical protein J5N97_006576 [Dioscorea zingiberensis]|uniref:Uncharacterized protein n=1 Tax=Dioscorea zingiberensis TaxID=325984 RepID=A0A9D5DA66_9LILI|nr:hypothetical protein J5N97_006576 [Dioscorea zingiberensis]
MELCERERPLFVDSNLGTHLAISVSPDITVTLLKDKLACEHVHCFPNFGDIKAHKLMVKRKSFLYHLPDSMVIKYAFQGLSCSWFIHMETTNLFETQEVSLPSELQQTTVHGTHQKAEPLKVNSNASSRQLLIFQDQRKESSTIHKGLTETGVLASDVKKNRDHYASGGSLKETAVGESACSAKGMKISEPDSGLHLNKRKHKKDDNTPEFQVSDENGKQHLSKYMNSCRTVTPSCSLSENTSITGIIFRYFSESDEVSSCSCRYKNTTETEKTTKIRKRSNAHNVCSSYAAELDAEQSDQGSFNVKKRKKVSNFMAMDESKSNQCGTKETVDSAMVNSTPTSTPRMFSLHSPLDKSMNASSGISHRIKVGNRLVQAATNIRLSASMRKSPISLLNHQSRRCMSSNSRQPVRHLVFEINDTNI